MSPHLSLAQRNPSWLNWLFALFMALMLAATLAPSTALAAPAAGTSIGNQAAATYTDASLVSRNVTSNTVSTIVQQVASFTLNTTGQIKTGSPGGTVYFAHYVTNTGNGTDTFDLGSTNAFSGGFAIGSVTLFADANGDGVPDNATPIGSTGALAAGGIFRFVAAATVPGGALNTQSDQFTVTAVGNASAATTGGYTAAVSQSNTDQINVSGFAVINVTKAISAGSGASPSGPHTYTLTYTNTGNSTATALTLTDPIPVGMTYVAASGRWSVTGALLVLTDATGDTQPATAPTIDYSVTGSTVTAIISAIPAGTSGTVTFQVNVNSGRAPTTVLNAADTNNTAAYTYHDGAVSVPSQNTNTVGFTVNQFATLTHTGATVASATQGATVSFTNIVTNTGNGTDSFDITVAAFGANNTFPAGTTFQLFKSDGVTPLVDTNGNSTPDTGLLAPGAAYNVILKATLPTSAVGGPFTVQKTATSKFNPAIFATATDTLTAITASVVDLTNNTARSDSSPLGTATAANATTPQPGATGFGSTTTTVITTNTADPGTTTRFTLYVNNVTGPADSYNLSTAGLPVGWSVVFRDLTSTGIGTGAVITNTGTINSGANRVVYADVTVAANASPGPTNVDFTVTSPTTGATDVKRDAVSVNTVNSVTLTPNNSGQVFPGGSVVYSHTLTNNGNVSQTITFPTAAFLTDSQAAAGWTSVLYIDSGPAGLDAGDVAVTTATTFPLLAGASQALLVKVFAPAGAAIGTIDTTTVTATYGAFTASATDTSTVIGGQVTLTKLQALDALCDGTADSGFVNTNITTGAIPGACIRYQVTATNVGSTDVTNLVVSDGTPANTVYNIGSPPNPAAVTGGGNTITAPAAGLAGLVQATIPTLTPGASVVITFGVKINP